MWSFGFVARRLTDDEYPAEVVGIMSPTSIRAKGCEAVDELGLWRAERTGESAPCGEETSERAQTAGMRDGRSLQWGGVGGVDVLRGPVQEDVSVFVKADLWLRRKLTER